MGSYYYSVCVITHKDNSILCDATVVGFIFIFFGLLLLNRLSTLIYYT